MEYRCVATTVTGFVQQLSCCYLTHGYWLYVLGMIPEHKDPTDVDRKLIAKYGIGISRQTRARRKVAGRANLHYLRYERTFILLATHGHHPFFEEEVGSIRDVRRVPITLSGYSISVKKGGYLRKLRGDSHSVSDDKLRVRVQIGREEYLNLKAYFTDIALRRTAEQLGSELYNLPYEPYAPIRQQLLNILRLINAKREAGGMDPVSPKVLRYRRKIVRPFSPLEKDEAA